MRNQTKSKKMLATHHLIEKLSCGIALAFDKDFEDALSCVQRVVGAISTAHLGESKYSCHGDQEFFQEPFAEYRIFVSKNRFCTIRATRTTLTVIGADPNAPVSVTESASGANNIAAFLKCLKAHPTLVPASFNLRPKRPLSNGITLYSSTSQEEVKVPNDFFRTNTKPFRARWVCRWAEKETDYLERNLYFQDNGDCLQAAAELALRCQLSSGGRAFDHNLEYSFVRFFVGDLSHPSEDLNMAVGTITEKRQAFLRAISRLLDSPELKTFHHFVCFRDPDSAPTSPLSAVTLPCAQFLSIDRLLLNWTWHPAAAHLIPPRTANGFEFQHVTVRYCLTPHPPYMGLGPALVKVDVGVVYSPTGITSSSSYGTTPTPSPRASTATAAATATATAAVESSTSSEGYERVEIGSVVRPSQALTYNIHIENRTGGILAAAMKTVHQDTLVLQELRRIVEYGERVVAEKVESELLDDALQATIQVSPCFEIGRDCIGRVGTFKWSSLRAKL